MVSSSASSAVRPGAGCLPSGPRSLGRFSLAFVFLRLGSSPVSRYYRLGPQRLGASSSSVLCSFRPLEATRAGTHKSAEARPRPGRLQQQVMSMIGSMLPRHSCVFRWRGRGKHIARERERRRPGEILGDWV